MDLLTQGLLGACAASAVARKPHLRKAVGIGFISGLAADLDILIASASDPLLNLEFHRHFTHSILFIPLAALLLTLLYWPLARRHFKPRELYLLAFVGYLPSGFLDACTSYGTLILWPMSDLRVSFNIISIIDPVFTVLLITGFALALIKQSPRAPQLALLLAAFYLGFGWMQKHSIRQQATQLALDRGHQPEKVLVKPTLGNLFLWRSVYRDGNRYHVDALRSNPFTGRKHLYPGGSITAFDAGHNPLALPEDSTLFKDIERFAYFSGQYLAIETGQPNLIIDLRYANLPNQIRPLWGIRINPLNPQEHARFVQFRDRSEAARKEFFNLLFPE
jgi:inner membrane protein